MISRTMYLDKIKPFINLDLIKLITGLRRSGKTVLLAQIQELLKQRGVDADHILSINFESLQAWRWKNPLKLYEYVSHWAESRQGKLYVFLDEIQEVPDWQCVVNSLRVEFDADIYVTGSNSTLLSGELATYLSGRYVQFIVYPFTFREAKALKKEQGTFTSNEALLADYLRYGGLPQRFAFRDDDSTRIYLMDLYEAVVLRDIISRHAIRDVGVLKTLLHFMMDNIGGPFSAQKISNTLKSQGIKVSVSTVLNYLDYFQEAFVLASAKRYDVKGRRLLASTEKYYALDLGLRNVVKQSEELDISKLYENLVYLELLSRGYTIQIGKLEQQEIDFICYKGTTKCYVQVAYLLTEEDEKREFGNLERIEDNYPKYVISADIPDFSRKGIIHKNIISFLLGE